MCQRRSKKSRMKLFRYRATAHHLAAFQHHRFESALGQIKRGDQSIVPAADDHYFLSQGHRQFPACARETLLIDGPPLFHSFKITVLAILPGAAMIPPPGCVADPHIYKLSIGVL